MISSSGIQAASLRVRPTIHVSPCEYLETFEEISGNPVDFKLGKLCGIMNLEKMSQALQLGDFAIDTSFLFEICRRYGVQELSIFGSAARNEMGPESDIDIMVEFQPGIRIGLIKFESLVDELERIAGRKVDLVTKGGLKPWVRPSVLKDARVIYAA